VYDKLHFFIKKSYICETNIYKFMEKAAIKAAIMDSLSEELDIWLDKQEKITDGYEYEDQFMATAQKVNKIILSKSMGKLPGSRNKKNSSPVLEK
jgi:hypothetical protein